MYGEVSKIVPFPKERRASRLTPTMRILVWPITLKDQIGLSRSSWLHLTLREMFHNTRGLSWHARYLHDVLHPLLNCRRLLPDSRSPLMHNLQETFLPPELDELGIGITRQQADQSFVRFWRLKHRVHRLQTAADREVPVALIELEEFSGRTYGHFAWA